MCCRLHVPSDNICTALYKYMYIMSSAVLPESYMYQSCDAGMFAEACFASDMMTIGRFAMLCADPADGVNNAVTQLLSHPAP